MRFGHDFHRRIVPEWRQYYVDYNLLKHLEKATGLAAYAELKNSLKLLASFFTLRFRALDIADAELCDLFALNPGSAAIADAADVCPLELTLLLEAFVEFHQELRKLQWFARVNFEAVEKILRKLWRRWEASSPFYCEIQTQWQEFKIIWIEQLHSRLDRCVKLIADIDGGLAPPRQDTGKSLYLTRAFHGRPWPQTVTDPIIQALRGGNSDLITEAVANIPDISAQEVQALVGDLLRYSVLLAPGHSNALLALLISPEQLFIEHHVVKWSILALGRRHMCDLLRDTMTHRNHHASSTGVFPLSDILKACTRQLAEVVQEKDTLGRLPLHYSAVYGLPEVCELLLLAMAANPASKAEVGVSAKVSKHAARINTASLEDTEGLTPLHLAISTNHMETILRLKDTIPDAHGDREMDTSDGSITTLVCIALLNGNDYVFRELMRRYALKIDFQQALQLAVQGGRIEYTSVLLECMSGQGIQADIGDRRWWTPLFQACALGHQEVVKLLLKAGFSQTRTDKLGWTAKEYATLQGHIAVAGLFEASESCNMTNGPDGPVSTVKVKTNHQDLHCGEGERIIIATLGTERVDRVVTEVDLSYCSSVYTPGHYEGLSYTLEVSSPGSASRPRTVQLPVLEDQINDPFVFPIPASVEPQLVFKVTSLRGGADGDDVLVSSGTALLEANGTQFGAGRQSLIREQTIPIFDLKTMVVAGTVTFTFLVVNPYPHLQAPRNVYLARRDIEPPLLVGHRGLGMNLKTHEYLQIGENTVESFLSAAKLGASFVEFDVQVTKDREAVIFHDFSLSEAGTDVPIHDLTLDQFRYASNIQSPHGNPLSILGPVHSPDEPSRRRSRSVGRQFEAGAIQVRDRMKHTVDFKLKGFKANTRGDFIQDTFATLKELLCQVPENVGFDMEISPSLS